MSLFDDPSDLYGNATETGNTTEEASEDAPNDKDLEVDPTPSQGPKGTPDPNKCPPTPDPIK